MSDIYLDRVVRIEDITQYGLVRRNIYGLNILYINSVEMDTRHDPRLILMKHLSMRISCTACIGYLSLKEMVDDPIEMFGKIDGKAGYIRVPLGLYGGTFYDLAQYPTQNACYFPFVTSAFWEAKTRYDDDIRSIFNNDAIALFVGVDDTRKIEHSLSSFTNEETLLQELASECRLIVTSGGDGSALSVYTSDTRFFSDIDQPLVDAVKTITDTHWYSQNKDNLVWNSDGDECLLLP